MAPEGRCQPSREEFLQKCREGNLIPVYREVLADLDTPVTAFLKVHRGDYGFLLESVEGGEKWARYCFLGSEPTVVFESRGERVRIRRGEKVEELRADGDPLRALSGLLAAYRPVPSEGLPRFFGGAVGYVSYDMVRFFERLPQRARDDLGLPESFFLLTDSLLIFDNLGQTIKVVANAHVEPGREGEAYDRAVARVEELIARLRSPRPPLPGDPPAGPAGRDLPLSSTFTRAGFEEAVRRAREEVLAGEAIQVVLAQRLEVPLRAHPFNIYRALRTVNPSPYMFYLPLGDLTLVGSSPEVMVRLEGRRVEVRPIAGTRRRGRDEEEDRELERELLSDEKERAEHIMLVDLGRNDVGRVSRGGSVRVTEQMAVERYSHVMHIVSNVQGELAPGLDAFDVFRACFPAGTVSGAPKVRAMELIEELEPTRRGPYAGAVGYFAFGGNMDTCIAIRTLAVRGDRVFLQVGAGIVADSVPAREHEETMNKARALLRAMELAAGGLA